MGLPIAIFSGQAHICRAELLIHFRSEVSSACMNERNLRPRLGPRPPTRSVARAGGHSSADDRPQRIERMPRREERTSVLVCGFQLPCDQPRPIIRGGFITFV